MKDFDKRIKAPRQCIRDYCLMHCERDKRKNSKRDVVECIIRECPLHPYRTGVMKGRSGPINNEAKRNRIARLERARYLVECAERKIEQEKERLKNGEDKVEEYKKRIHKAESELKKRKNAVRKIEIAYNDELEAGIWNTDRIDVDG